MSSGRFCILCHSTSVLHDLYPYYDSVNEEEAGCGYEAEILRDGRPAEAEGTQAEGGRQAER